LKIDSKPEKINVSSGTYLEKNENCKFSPDFISRIRESTILPNRNAHNLCINATNGVPDIDQVSFPRLEIDHKNEPMEVQCRY